MKDWGEENFANEGARAYLGMLTARLVATIKEIYADEERLALDEDGESMLMPSIEVLALLCERYNAPPPKPNAVRQWATKYLEVYDATIDDLQAPPEFKAARRKVIDHTFRWLECLASSYWDQ